MGPPIMQDKGGSGEGQTQHFTRKNTHKVHGKPLTTGSVRRGQLLSCNKKLMPKRGHSKGWTCCTSARELRRSPRCASAGTEIHLQPMLRVTPPNPALAVSCLWHGMNACNWSSAEAEQCSSKVCDVPVSCALLMEHRAGIQRPQPSVEAAAPRDNSHQPLWGWKEPNKVSEVRVSPAMVGEGLQAPKTSTG